MLKEIELPLRITILKITEKNPILKDNQLTSCTIYVNFDQITQSLNVLRFKKP